MTLMRRAAYAAGMMIRETGQALDRAGSRLQGSYAFKEQLSRHRQVMNLRDSKPIISSDVFLAPSCSLIGNVEVQPSASVWYGAVVRGDTAPIQIGERSSIGDRAVIRGHTSIGSSSTICSGAVVDGANIGPECMIGPGAVVMPGSTLGAGAMVRAGSFVPYGTSIGEGEIWAGSPATMQGMLDAEKRQEILQGVDDTVALAGAHAVECGKTHEQIEAEELRQKLMDERSEDYNSHLGLLGREREIVEVQARFVESDREEQRKVGAA